MTKAIIILPVAEDIPTGHVEELSSLDGDDLTSSSSSSGDSNSRSSSHEADSSSDSDSPSFPQVITKNKQNRSGIVNAEDKEEQRNIFVKIGDNQDEFDDVEDPPTEDIIGSDGKGAAVEHNRFAFLNTPAFLIGSSLLFLIIVIVVEVVLNNKGGSSRTAPAVDNPIIPIFVVESTTPTLSPIATIVGVSEQETDTSEDLTTVEAPSEQSTVESSPEASSIPATAEESSEQTPDSPSTSESPTTEVSSSESIDTVSEPTTTVGETTEEQPTEEIPTVVTVEAPADEPTEEGPAKGNWTEQIKMFVERSSPNTNFGASVALDGGTLVVASGVGAFVFAEVGDEWIFESALALEASQGNSSFGSCIATNGEMVLVGDATYDNGEGNEDVGIVYVFNRDEDGSWRMTATVQARDGKSGDRFGSSCALSDNRMVVGAPFVDSDEQRDVGAAYVYTFEDGEWTFDAALAPADDSACSGNSLSEYKFGTNVAVVGNRIVAGPAPEQTCRRVHIFHRSGASWSQEFEVGGNGDCPYSLSLSDGGNSLAIGDSCGSEENRGTVSVYTRSGDKTWNLDAQISARRARKEDRFGESVSLDGGNLLIGRPRNGGAEMYIRAEGGWSDAEEFVLNGGENTGGQIALSGSIVVIGNPFDDEAGENTGAVHVFRYVEVAPGGELKNNEAADEEDVDRLIPTEEAPTEDETSDVFQKRIRVRRTTR